MPIVAAVFFMFAFVGCGGGGGESVVDIDTNQTIVSIVGNEIAETRDVMKKLFDAIEPIPVRMVSYGGSKHNVSLLISRKYKEETLQLLNAGLFGL